MQDTKLIQVCATLSSTQWTALRDMVHSPYFNKNEHVVALFVYIDKQYPALRPSKLAKQAVWQALYPQQTFDDLKLRHISSLLFKVVEQFIAIEGMQQRPSAMQLQLMEYYRKQQLPKHHRTITRQANKWQQELNQPDEYDRQAVLEYYQELELQALAQGQPAEYIQEVNTTLDNLYLAQKLKLACGMWSYQNVLKKEFDYTLIDEIVGYLNVHPPTDALINSYYLALLTLKEAEDESHFTALQQCLANNAEQMPLQELRDLYVLARNYCIKQLNTGKRKYISQLFELYRSGLESGSLLNDDGGLDGSAYKNIVAVALNQKQYEWTEHFLNNYSDKLTEEQRSDFLNYNLAKLYFEQRQFSEVVGQLSQVDYKDRSIALDARTLLLKTYLEMGEYEALIAMIDSFRQFIRRHKALGYHTKNYRNLLKYTRQVAELPPGNTTKRMLVKKQIEEENDLTEKQWLLAKLA